MPSGPSLPMETDHMSWNRKYVRYVYVIGPKACITLSTGQSNVQHPFYNTYLTLSLLLLFFLLRICDCTWEKGPCRASFQNRVITTIGKSRL